MTNYLPLLLLLVFTACTDDSVPPPEEKEADRTALNSVPENDRLPDFTKHAIDENDVTGRLNNSFNRIEKLMEEDADVMGYKDADIIVTDNCEVYYMRQRKDGTKEEYRFNLNDFQERNLSLLNDDDADVQFPGIQMRTDRNLAKVTYYENGKKIRTQATVDITLANKKRIEEIAAVVPQVLTTCTTPVLD